MGQLERYGLYVLCVVIFLILGVALWGGDPAAAAGSDSVAAAVSRDLRSQPAVTQEPVPSEAKEKDDAVHRLRRAFGSSSESDQPKATPGSVEPLSGVSSAPTAEPGKTEAAPTPPAATDYVIKQGDNLEAIALLHLGKRSAWPDIVKVNPGLSPTKLVTGDRIKLPAKNAAAGPEPAAASTDEYEIKRGDNLESIALARLGKKSLWRDIVAANPGLDATRLRPGKRIKIPAVTANPGR